MIKSDVLFAIRYILPRTLLEFVLPFRSTNKVSALLDHGKEHVRHAAAVELGRRRSHEAAVALIACIDKAAASHIDSPQDSPAYVHAIRASLGPGDGMLVGIAINALGDIGDPDAVEPLCKVLLEWESFHVYSAAEALGKIGDPRAVVPLITRLHTGVESLKISIAEALAKLGDPRAVTALAEEIERSKVGVFACRSAGFRSVAQSAIDQLTQRRRLE